MRSKAARQTRKRPCRSCVTRPEWTSSLRWNDKALGAMPKALGQRSGGHAGVARHDQRAKRAKAMGLREGGEGLDYVSDFAKADGGIKKLRIALAAMFQLSLKP